MAGERQLDLVFEPTDNTALAGFGFTKDYLYLNVLEDVKNRVYVCRLGDPQWTRQPLVGAPGVWNGLHRRGRRGRVQRLLHDGHRLPDAHDARRWAKSARNRGV